MKNVWNLVEERKKEDQLLRAQFGWASRSQSGISSSQPSQHPQRSQSRDALSGLQGQQSHLDFMDNYAEGSSRRSLSTFEQTRIQTPLQVNEGLSNIPVEEEFFHHAEITKQLQVNDTREPRTDINAHDTSITSGNMHQIERSPTAVQEVRQYLVDKPSKMVGQDIEDEDDDEGIPWF
jgi:hypothetical protein